MPKTYFYKHPPEVFLVKDDRDAIHSSLLNFIPDIETATYGTDNKWTGKLYEWNMNSDSLFVQEIKDNKALLRYIIGASNAPINNNAKNNVKTNISLSGIGNFFGAIGAFFNNVGYFLGILGGTNSLWYSRGCDYTGYGCTRTWAWAADAIGWIGENFFSSGSAGADGGSGFGFYNNYLPYYGYGAGDGIPTGGGSGGFLPIYRGRINAPNIGNGALIAGSIEANELINDLEITDNNIQTFLRSNDVKSLALYDYLRINSWSTDNKNFIKWAAGYLFNNQTTLDFEEFKNQFLGKSEGQDGVYDAQYWENPNLSFQVKTLPSLQEFLTAFPKVKNNNSIRNLLATDVYSLVGGEILINHLNDPDNYTNACALRCSRALNYSQKEIEEFDKTEKGSDNKNYILSAKAFNIYMNKTFGAPSSRLVVTSTTTYQDMVDFMVGKTGMYTLLTKDFSKAGFTGHADLIYNGQVLGGSNIDAKGGINVIEIWELN